MSMKKNKKLFVSVLMPACNAEGYIEEAVKSVLEQDYTFFELIIADDFSDDSTKVILEKCFVSDARVKVIHNSTRLGEAATRNRLIEAVSEKSDVIAIMDSDDICEPNRLGVQALFLQEHGEISIVGSNVTLINENSTIIGKRRYLTSSESIARRRFIANPFAHPSVMVRTNVLKQLGGYDGSRQRICDYELWMRLLMHYKGANIDQYLLQYRISSTQAKTNRTRDILRATLILKWKYLSFFEIINPLVLTRMLGELILYLMPKWFALTLFYWHLDVTPSKGK